MNADKHRLIRVISMLVYFGLCAMGCDAGEDDDATIEEASPTPALETDLDGDGFPAELDCDDQDPQAHTGATEVCDLRDNDCDGFYDEGVVGTWFIDADGDTFGSTAVFGCDRPAETVTTPGDCDDSRADIHPGTVEVCNFQDDDCDGDTDEDLYPDQDGDGYGTEDAVPDVCAWTDASVAGDCDDADAGVHAGARELCDGLDNDCDGVADNAFFAPDNDGDGYGGEDVDPERCEPGDVPARGDCDDGDVRIFPGAPDTPGDGIDADCGGGDSPEPSVGLAASGFVSIQAALDAAAGGETIWVAPGTHAVSALSFRGKGVTLASISGPSTTVLDAGEMGATVVFESGEGPDAVLDGFTITGGRSDANWCSDDRGYSMPCSAGGIRISGASPTVRDCRVVGNTGGAGGIWMSGSSATLLRCDINRNSGFYGVGGVFMYESDPTLIDCRIESNVVTSGYYFSAALYGRAANPDLMRCRIRRNTGAGSFGVMISGEATLTNCLIAENEGGGCSLQSSVLRNCRITGNGGRGLSASGAVSVTSCIIAHNGGGVAYSSDGGSLHLDNSVIVGNQGGTSEYAGLYASYVSPTSLVVQNSILAYNTPANLLSSYGAQVFHSIVYNPEGTTNTNLSSLDPSSLEVEPGFLSYSEGEPALPVDFHLEAGSPAQDSGSGMDPDGGPADMGAYGGPHGAGWDLDGDGFSEWFWPGPISAAPAGFVPADYDVADQDPMLH